MPKLYSLNIRWVKTQVNTQIIENVLNGAGDWFRFDAWSWLLASEYGAADVMNALRTVLKPEDSILIIKCDPDDYSGFAPTMVWEWLNKYRTQSVAVNAGLGANALSMRPPPNPPGLGLGMVLPKKG